MRTRKPFNSLPGEYFGITRRWQDGEQIEVQFDMYTYDEYFPDQSPYMAILHDPIVLAAATGNRYLDGIFANDSRMGHVAPLKNSQINKSD